MIITDIRAVQPASPGSPPDWRTSLGQILVRVDTDGDIAGIHIIRTVIREKLIGQEIKDLSDLWEQMYHATLPFGRKGVAIMGISGVDLALWDAQAKSEDKAVAELLGGTAPKQISCYATVHGDPQAALSAGFQAIKIHFSNLDEGAPARQIIETVRAVRDMAGPQVQLMIDTFMKWDVSKTLKVADGVAPLDVRWLEEPLPPDDLEGYEELNQRCPVAIAALDPEPLAETGRPWMSWVQGHPPITDGKIRLSSKFGFGAFFNPSLWQGATEVNGELGPGGVRRDQVRASCKGKKG